MQASEQINELAAALAKAQGEIQAVAKDKVNPYFNSRYSSLSAIQDAIRAPLAKNGLAVAQGVSAGDGLVVISQRLMHSSGQWIEESLALPIRVTEKQNFVQVVGSTITYGRRYLLSAMVGVVADEDDDGNAVTEPSRRRVESHPSGNGQDKLRGSAGSEPSPDDVLGGVGAADSDGKPLNGDHKKARTALQDAIAKARNSKGKANEAAILLAQKIYNKRDATVEEITAAAEKLKKLIPEPSSAE